MSFQALACVRDVQPPSSAALLILYVLAEYAGADGTCFPSQNTLAERCKLSVRAVRDNVGLLIRDGIISIERRARKDGTRTSNKVTLLYYVPEEADEAPSKIRKPRAESAAGGKAGNPSSDKCSAGASQRRNLPVDQRHHTSRQPAPAAGLTTFEPVTEHITLARGEPGSSADEATSAGLAGELPVVPFEIRSVFIADPRFGEKWVASWLDPCRFDPQSQQIHARSEFARGRLRQDIGAILRDLGCSLGEPRPVRS